MTLAQLALAILALLVTPGPTNTLLAIAGAERGWRGAVRLIPAELLAYLAVAVPLATLGAGLLAALPGARAFVTALAAAWLLWLAAALWREGTAHRGQPAVTARRVAVTTLLNPKALVFGLVLLPSPDPARLLLNLAAFAALVVAVAMLWARLGATLRSPTGAGLPRPWRRAAALCLAALALTLAARLA